MSLNSFLSKLFGNKSQRDLREVEPFIEKIKQVYPQIQKLSNDELRLRTKALQEKIAQNVSKEQERINSLKEQIEQEEIDKREELWEEIDKLEKTILEKNEIVLDEILPEAFAIIKDTARRFAENQEVVVTATDFDRTLSTKHSFITINGDKAIYQNRWEAGGNETIWDMIHYDVQLIGGVVLHKGKIAEMATGEGKTLVATLPVFLNALTGRGVHIVTVNDYLAKRDSEWMDRYTFSTGYR